MLNGLSDTWFTQPPEWTWLIILYFLFGGLAGGSYFFAALSELSGNGADRPVARNGYLIALPCLVVSGLILLVDLDRPDRFWHLFVQSHTYQPMFKAWSPMSTGAWALVAFGVFALASFMGVLTDAGRLRWARIQQLRPPGRLGTVLVATGAVCGLYVAGYTGVLLAVTNRPIWSDTPLLGMLLVVSSASISAALIVALTHRRHGELPGVIALQRIGHRLIMLEFVVLMALIASLGTVARAWLSVWGLALLVGTIAIGMIVPLILDRRRANARLTAVLVITGGIVLRTVIVYSSESIHP